MRGSSFLFHVPSKPGASVTRLSGWKKLYLQARLVTPFTVLEFLTSILGSVDIRLVAIKEKHFD